ncbi:NAD(P)H dehydrogenase (quinone) FQR1 [Zea mays]|uniref:NAD(P)H dehydrogenase (quinone) n=1 Tax=Zea mays TaxID=4577 RepID=A0A1D6LYS1_MAIZE|nr:NAD(P)H dehydrogenase (quinone) FQR1 [Zea mays]AQK84267.1 NAD(P)H dehydrogenase (quinone) FQR1 [Zea mays]|eukprot:XP_008649359.1 NAD(P)H dehydrogenase (quinone) FQR1 [Zea mays]
MATKIYIVYYSTWGHVAALAEEIKKGADAVAGVEATVWRVAETLPEEVLGKMGAAPAREDHPVISPRQLADADAVLLGFPTRFGMMAAQMKAFLDATGGLWQGQALAGKPAGVFLCTGTQGGGQETTALTAVTQLAHHGMLFVPVGYTFGAGMFGIDQVRGGSPYGAGTFAGADGSRTPTEVELAMARHQGTYFAGIAKKLKAGAAALAAEALA